MNIPRQGFERVCWNKELRMDQADAVVWQEVCRLLEEPERLEQEYRRRLLPQQEQGEHEGLEIQMSKLRRGIARLIDSYADGLIDKQEFEPRVRRMRERMQHLETQLQCLKEDAEMEGELRLILGQLETFAAKVKTGLQHADFSTRREIIRTLVKRVEVDEQQIRVIFRVGPTWSPSSSEDASYNWQHCGRRVDAGTFHGHMGAPSFEKPLTQRFEISGVGLKTFEVFVGVAVFHLTQANEHKALMHIDPTTTGIENFTPSSAQAVCSCYSRTS